MDAASVLILGRDYAVALLKKERARHALRLAQHHYDAQYKEFRAAEQLLEGAVKQVAEGGNDDAG